MKREKIIERGGIFRSKVYGEKIIDQRKNGSAAFSKQILLC